MTNHNMGEHRVSLNPDDAVDDPQTLYELLEIGEQREDFRYVDEEERDPPRRTLDGVVDWVSTALKQEARNRKITKAVVQRLATKAGILRLRELSEWAELTSAYERQVRKAKEQNDRMAIRFLESRPAFKFAHPVSRKTGISLYPWVVVALDDAAEVAGISASAMVVAILILGLATISEWEGRFADDINEFIRHLKRRRAPLEGDL